MPADRESRVETGRQGEKCAADHLAGLGYIILERNWRAGANGEIDLVAMDESSLVFVEVKTSTSGSFGPPEGWVTPKKQKRLTGLAERFLASHEGEFEAARFDVVAVRRYQGRWIVKHIKDAFDAL